jgi:hypothetical protein
MDGYPGKPPALGSTRSIACSGKVAVGYPEASQGLRCLGYRERDYCQYRSFGVEEPFSNGGRDT